MRTCDLVSFSASISARLATVFGASKMRWRSFAGGLMRLNSVRFTRVFLGFISLAITDSQLSDCSFHPRRLWDSLVLLIYTHNFFSSSEYWVATSMFRAGVYSGICGRVVLAVVVLVFCAVGNFVYYIILLFKIYWRSIVFCI